MADNDIGGPGDYEVGYGKPPTQSRFQPGQSGNPRGRRKGTRGLKSDLHDELASSHTIQVNGQAIKGTKQRLMILTLSTRAATGDLKAAALLLPLIQQAFGFEDRGGEQTRLSPQDAALLDQLLSGPADPQRQASAEANPVADDPVDLSDAPAV